MVQENWALKEGTFTTRCETSAGRLHEAQALAGQRQPRVHPTLHSWRAWKHPAPWQLHSTGPNSETLSPR